jgi:hypothetical protein
MNNLAGSYNDQGKYAQAEALYSQTLEISRRVLGREHPDTLMCMGKLARRLFLSRQVLREPRHCSVTR